MHSQPREDGPSSGVGMHDVVPGLLIYPESLASLLSEIQVKCARITQLQTCCSVLEAPCDKSQALANWGRAYHSTSQASCLPNLVLESPSFLGGYHSHGPER